MSQPEWFLCRPVLDLGRIHASRSFERSGEATRLCPSPRVIRCHVCINHNHGGRLHIKAQRCVILTHTSEQVRSIFA